MDAPPVQYVKTSDGYNIAHAVAGEGTPLIFVVPSLGHNVQLVYRRHPEWMEGLAGRFRLVTCDLRGRGLSSRGLREDLSLSDYLHDIEALVDKLDCPRIWLFATGQSGHHMVRYADAHPERVEALIWNVAHIEATAWPLGLFWQFARENWDYFLSTLISPGLPMEMHNKALSELRESVTPEDYRVAQVVNRVSSVETELSRLHVPLLVLFPRQFRPMSPSEGTRVAALTPNARLVLIEGTELFGDAAQGLAAIDDFVASLPPAREVARRPVGHPNLSERELDVLKLLALGNSNPQIAEELFITRNTVQNHLKSIYRKIEVKNRAQAAVYAQQHRLV